MAAPMAAWQSVGSSWQGMPAGLSGQSPSSSSAAPKAPGLIARISNHVSEFEDKLRNSNVNASGQSATLGELIRHGLSGGGRAPDVDAELRPWTPGQQTVAKARSTGCAATSSAHRPRRDNGRRNALSRSSGSDADGSDASSTKGRGARDVTHDEAGFTDVASHLRSFLQHQGWDTCIIEQMPSMDGASSSHSSLQPLERFAAVGEIGWHRFRAACAAEGALVRGWICGHLPKHKLMRVRIVAVESTTSDDLLAVSDQAENLEWLVPPIEDDGFFGVLRAHDESGVMPMDIESADRFLPAGTLIRARLLHSDVDRRLLRACEASCELSLSMGGTSMLRPPGILCQGPVGSEEWLASSATIMIAMDPHFKNKHNVRSNAHLLGIHSMHSTLLRDSRGVDPAVISRGMQLSQTQSRMWADKRVREGISKARAGEQKAALERYDAALELCPRHKEGLVGRGAALVNVGRLHDALRDFDLALELDPNDSNAMKYREIARRRARDEGISGGSRQGDDRKRRRGPVSSRDPVTVR